MRHLVEGGIVNLLGAERYQSISIIHQSHSMGTASVTVLPYARLDVDVAVGLISHAHCRDTTVFHSRKPVGIVILEGFTLGEHAGSRYKVSGGTVEHKIHVMYNITTGFRFQVGEQSLCITGFCGGNHSPRRVVYTVPEDPVSSQTACPPASTLLRFP